MNIGGKEYATIAVIDDQNNLLCTVNDTTAIAVEKIRVIAEEKTGNLAFITMENGVTRCYVRDDTSVLPKGALTSEEFFKTNLVEIKDDSVPEGQSLAEHEQEVIAAEATPKEEEKQETEKVQEEKQEKSEEEKPDPFAGTPMARDIKVIEGELGPGAEGIMNFLKNIPPEILGNMIKKIAQSTKDNDKQ